MTLSSVWEKEKEMPSQFEVHTKCPNTGGLVDTGHRVAKSVFSDGEKPRGGFNCSSCKEIHSWSSEDEDVQILEVYR